VLAVLLLLAGVLFVASQLVTDLLQALLFGGGSYVVGFTTYSLWKLDVNKVAADIGVVFLFLPLFIIVATAPYSSPSQNITAATNWLVAYVQGLPASILGDIGGSAAAALLGMGGF
jgi:hypothetical protein